MTTWIKGLIFAGTLLIAITLPSVVAAADYYVSPNGQDDNPGTEGSPWRTLEKAAETAEAGDTVYIMQGTYNEILRPENSGEPDNPIIFTAYPNHTVTLDREERSKGAYGAIIQIADTSYIEVSNLNVVNSGHYGISVSESEHILVKGNRTDFTYSSGIYVGDSEHVVIDGNRVERACHGIGGNPPHYAPQEHITIRSTNYFEVKNNLVHKPHNGRGKEGINVKEGASNGKVYNNRVHNMSRTGLYVDAYNQFVSNVTIYGNIVTGSLHGIVIASEQRGTVSDILIYNNLFYNNLHNGVWVTHYMAGGPMRNISIVNNTLYNNAAQGVFVSNPEVTNILVRNNIALENHQGQIEIGDNVPSVTNDHNLTTGDANFVNAADGDFRLRGGSPAIDSGSSEAAPAFDFAGTPRHQGEEYDIGAYEFAVGGSADPPGTDPDPTPEPDPSPDPDPTPSPEPPPTSDTEYDEGLFIPFVER